MRIIRKIVDIILVMALVITCINTNCISKAVKAAEVDPVTNLQVTNYSNWTGKYLIYFTAPAQADGYKVFVDDDETAIKEISGSGTYVTNDDLSEISAGEHYLRVAAYVTVDQEELISSKASVRFTKSAQSGTNSDIPQVYIKSGSITTEYRDNSDVSVTIVDQDGGSKGLGSVDNDGSHPDSNKVSKYGDVIDTESNIKIRGNTTSTQPKKAWNIKLSGKTSILGIEKGKKWCLLANSMDKSLMRDTLSYNFGLENGVKYTSQSKYVDVYLNGEYQGNYQLCEPVEAKSNRVETDAYNADNNDILLEVGTRNEPDVDHFTTSVLGQTFDVNDPEKGDDLTDEQVNDKIQRAKTFLNQFENVLRYNVNDLNAISEYIDVDSFVDFYVVNELFKNVDFNFSSTRFYIKDNKIYAGPMWDLDLSSGNCKSSFYTNYYVNGDSTKGFYCRNLPWYSNLFNNTDFSNKVKKRFYDLQYKIQSLYRTDSTEVNSIDYLKNRFGASFERNYKSKSQLGAGWPIRFEDGYSFAAESNWQTWEDPIEFLRNWLNRRNTWMCEQWNIDMNQAYADSKEWSENPTTAGPTTQAPTTTVEPTTKGTNDPYKNQNWKLATDGSDYKVCILDQKTTDEFNGSFQVEGNSLYIAGSAAIMKPDYKSATLNGTGLTIWAGAYIKVPIASLNQNSDNILEMVDVFYNQYTIIIRSGNPYPDTPEETTAQETTREETTTKETTTEETTTEADVPEEDEWVPVEAGDGQWHYNNSSRINISGVVNVQQPPFANERGIYVTVPVDISEVSINGVSQSAGGAEQSICAIQGAGVVLFLSAMTSYTNEITIKNVSNISYIQIRNSSANESKTGNHYDVEVYKSNNIYPTKSGLIFAGWFQDEDYTTAYEGTSGNAYAKFVDAKSLTFKYQWNADHNALRFVSSIDSLSYQSVGFVFNGTYGDNTINQTTKEVEKVYSKITAANESIIPTVFSKDSKYFFTYTIRNMDGSKASTWKVTPYYVTLDGTSVKGTQATAEYTP